MLFSVYIPVETIDHLKLKLLIFFGHNVMYVLRSEFLKFRILEFLTFTHVPGLA